MERRRYFAHVKSFPINIDFNDTMASGDTGAVYTAYGRLAGHEAPIAVAFLLRPLASFIYNERYALEAVIDLGERSGSCCDHLTLRFLPLGCLVASFVHRIPADQGLEDVEQLKAVGLNCYEKDLALSGLIFDLIADLSHRGVIRHCPSLPYDMLDPHDFWQREPSREQFCSEMAWRAWSSGNFVAIGPCDEWPWPREADYRPAPVQQSPNGRFAVLFTNYFGWCLEQARAVSDDTAAIADELEPVMYMISRRSQCASGLRNIQDLSRAFVWERHKGLTITDMRRYVSATRLAMLAPREYEESTDKSLRAIYHAACRDLTIDTHVAEVSACINMLAEDVRGLQAERDEAESRMLNRIAFCLTCVFGLSAVNDLSRFIGFENTLLTPWARIGLLAGVLTLVVSLLWRLMRGYQRARTPARSRRS